MRVVSLVLLALVALALPRAALAASDVFTVRDVAVDATSDGAAQARDIAIAQGQHGALQLLMQRLTRRDDWSRLPDVASDQMPNLILGFEVADEHTSSTHYLAKVTYRFKPPAIRNLLRTAGIGFSETRSRAVLLLPVYESSGQIVLFEEPNPWKAAWARRDLDDELVPVLLPSNDLEDSRVLTAAQAKVAAWSDVAGLAQKYGVERVMIADAATNAGGLTVKVHVLSAGQDSPNQMTFTGSDLNALFDQAAEAGLSRLTETWKAATIVNSGEQNTLVASVPFGSLHEWVGIRSKLNRIPTVAGVNLLALSTQGAEVQLTYAGTPEQLRITLDQVSLTLAKNGDYWQITGPHADAQSDAGPASDAVSGNADAAPPHDGGPH